MDCRRVLGFALFAMLVGAGASAETYRILMGTLSGPGGRSEPLTGEFTAHESTGLAPGSTLLLVDDFALAAAGQTFTPAPSVEFDGLRPVLEVGSTIEVLEGDVPWGLLRSGGELIGSNELQATFRFFDFRSEASDPSRAVGLVYHDSSVPRRLHLAGTLYEVEQSFEIQNVCVRLDDPLIITEPDSSQAGDISLVAPGGVGEAPLSSDPGGSVSIGGDVGRLIPADVSFRIVIVQPPPNPIPLPFCSVLWPIDPAVEHAIGHFEIVATAARPIAIDVQPARAINVVLPGSPGRVSVAILGDEHLDVSQVSVRSLRLGDGEAEPASSSRHEHDVDRDGDLDLVARFPVRDTGIAFGDDLICLVAREFTLDTLEGCDAIQTLPGR